MAKPFAPKPCPGPGYELVHPKWITLRNGKRIYATSYGKQCFTFWAKRRK